MFEVKAQKAKLQHMNLRGEQHGEDPVTGVDLKVEVKLANDELAMFHPTLKSLLYHYDATKADLDDQAREEDDHKPHLRFADMDYPIRWKTELVGAAVKIDFGLGADIDLDGCKVNRFRIGPEEGGTCVITFRVQCTPDEKQIGKLSMLIQNEITISVTPPSAAQQELNEDEEETA